MNMDIKFKFLPDPETRISVERYIKENNLESSVTLDSTMLSGRINRIAFKNADDALVAKLVLPCLRDAKKSYAYPV